MVEVQSAPSFHSVDCINVFAEIGLREYLYFGWGQIIDDARRSS